MLTERVRSSGASCTAEANALSLLAPPPSQEFSGEAAERYVYLGRMVSAVAHEITNRLTAVLGYAELAGLQSDAGNALGTVKKLKISTDGLRHLTEGICGFSNLNKNGRQPHDIVALARQVADMASCEAKARGICFSAVFPDEPLMVPVQPSEFKLALFVCLYESVIWLPVHGLTSHGDISLRFEKIPGSRDRTDLAISIRSGPGRDGMFPSRMPPVGLAQKIFQNLEIASDWRFHEDRTLDLVVRLESQPV